MKGSDRIVLCVLFVCFLSSSLTSFAQVFSLKFENIGSGDGLPQSTVYGITRDKYGFMWFGTLAGLCRYDGYRFKVYRFDPANSRSISSNQIDNVIKDTKGDIWISTQATYELCRYNYEKDDFDRINNNRIPANFLKLFPRAAHGRSAKYNQGPYQWKLEKYSTLVQIDTLTKNKTYYFANPSNPWALPDHNVSYFYRDAQSILWVGTFNKGICKANINAKPFGYYYHDPLNANSIADNVVTAINRDTRGDLWIGTYDKGISVLGKSGTKQLSLGEVDKIGLSFNQVRTILCDSRGDVWIGTRKGLLRYNGKTGNLTGFDSVNVYNHTVQSIIEDKKRDVWIASRREGIYKYVVSRGLLINYDHIKTLKTRDARALIQDHRGLIWVGTETGGVSVLKPVKDTVLLVKRFLAKGVPGSLSDNRIYCLYEDKDGMIWIGTGDGLDCYSPKTGKFTRMFNGTDLSGILVSAIAEDEKGNLWISHKRGLTRLNRTTLNFRTFSFQDGLQSNEFLERSVYKDKAAHKLYFGSNYGLNFFDPDSIKRDRTLPRTVLTQLQVLSHPVEINQEVNGRVILTKPLYLTNQLELIHSDKSFSIEFAGLHYANPNGNKYAYMLDGFDKEWIFTDASRRLATYSNLDAGTYTFMVKSSNSDGVWNDKPVLLKIVVNPPFWASTWAYLFYLLVLFALVYAYHLYSSRYNRLQNAVLIKSKEQELEKQKLQFFTNISHEIKTPLTLILAPLQKLPSLVSDKQAFEEQLQIMKSNADRLLRMINQLLDFRRLETGNVSLDLRKHNLIAFLRHMVISFEPLLSENRMSIRFEHNQEDLFLVYDEDKLEKVISNLLSNAIKFSASGSEIKLDLSIELHEDRELVKLAVINEGRGIPENEQQLIFEPFKQGKASVNGGTGLGLAYSRGLIEQHGGTIDVVSEANDTGLFKTTFCIYLPLDLNDQAVSLVSEPDPFKFPGTSPATEVYPAGSGQSANENPVLINGRVPLLLVVDDNHDLRNYIRAHFQTMYQVIDAGNGRQGLELATEHLPDLIISDVMMPEMDGQEFCRRIKSSPNTAHIPLILLTAKAPIENEIEGYETGADDYIIKPFNLNHLTARVKNLLLSRLQLKEKYRSEISLSPSNDIPLSADDKLLQNFLKYVEERIADPEMNVDEICKVIGISRSQLYRRIKSLTGLSVSDLVKEIRLKRAKQLLKDRKFNVSEVAYMVGFANADHFRRCFKVEFGIAPSDFQKNGSEG